LENIALPAMLSGKSKDEALSRAQTLLSQVNLVGKEKNNPNQLSGGERQRVAIARSMSNDPSFLVMDEPTGNLDSQNVQSFMDLLMNMISEKDITLIIATHDQNVSSRLNKLLSLE
jgi:ABC-type lipoprotein export system ATPase subunit